MKEELINQILTAVNNSSGGEIEFEADGLYHLATNDGLFVIYNDEQDDIEFTPYPDFSDKKLGEVLKCLTNNEGE